MTYPSEIVDEAMRSGYYKRMNTYALFAGQEWVTDQMTGIGRVEGKMTGAIHGYVAEIELRVGFISSLYITAEEAENHKGNPETYVLSKLIKNVGIQNYQGEIKHEQPNR